MLFFSPKRDFWEMIAPLPHRITIFFNWDLCLNFGGLYWGQWTCPEQLYLNTYPLLPPTVELGRKNWFSLFRKTKKSRKQFLLFWEYEIFLFKSKCFISMIIPTLLLRPLFSLFLSKYLLVFFFWFLGL